jgi:hypothetical protein
VALEGLQVHALVEQTVDAVLDRGQALLHHHVALGPHLLRGEGQVEHPVGLQLDGQGEAVGGDLVDVGGVVVRGGGVGVAADLFHAAVELAGGPGAPGLGEHQVFEQVGEAGLAGRGVLVARADPEPAGVAEAGGGGVGGEDHLQAVVQAPLGEAERAQGGPADEDRTPTSAAGSRRPGGLASDARRCAHPPGGGAGDPDERDGQEGSAHEINVHGTRARLTLTWTST